MDAWGHHGRNSAKRSNALTAGMLNRTLLLFYSSFRGKGFLLFWRFREDRVEKGVSGDYLALVGLKLDDAGSLLIDLSFHDIMHIVHEAIIGFRAGVELCQGLFI